MEIKVAVTEENGVKTRMELTPKGMVDIVTYCPHSTPWDCYGRKEQNEKEKVLKAAGIECVKLVTHQERLNPMGSGPGGRVRMGDSSMPGVYRVAVHEEFFAAAEAALTAHQKAVQDWLDGVAPMPEVCRNN